MIEVLLGCGNFRSLGFHATIYNVALPNFDEDYALGLYQADNLTYLEVMDLETSDPPAIQRLGGKESEIDFALILQGFNIWCEVSRRISFDKGREDKKLSSEDLRVAGTFSNRCLAVLEDW